MKAAVRCLLFVCAVPFLVATIVRAQTPVPSKETYGAYPENYQEIVAAWLHSSLSDPKSVQLKWLGDPKPGKLPVGKGQEVAGYLVEFTVNARNLFGAYTGPQKHVALVRDGQVVTATGFLYH